MEIYTIGFAKKSAREFFETLRRHGIRRLLDVRLNNRSQLAGFTKETDLPYFLGSLCDAEYVHLPELAPTAEALAAYRKKEVTWEEYERQFKQLIAQRKVEAVVDKDSFSVPTAILCSEPKADRCHRRLVAEYLASKWGGAKITHL